MMPDLDLVSQAEAAELLGVSEYQVAKFRANGRLAFFKTEGGGVRIRRQHISVLAACLAEPRPTRAIRRAISADARELPASFLRPIIRAAISAA
jgi:excisionase family DNA binding protein